MNPSVHTSYNLKLRAVVPCTLAVVEEIPGHEGCRLREFQRWPRVVLEHEREFLSAEMGQSGAFIDDQERVRVLHDLQDLDHFLAQLPPKETKTQ